MWSFMAHNRSSWFPFNATVQPHPITSHLPTINHLIILFPPSTIQTIPTKRKVEKKRSKTMAGELELKQEQEGLKVKETKKYNVQPRKKIGRKECQLVTFDLPYLAFYYNQKLLFYKGGKYEEIVERLKDGLSTVLEEFYPLAGKIGKDDDGVFKVEYDDDMEGVEIVEAIAGEDVGVDDLVVKDDMFGLKALLPNNEILNLEGLHRPLLAVQITKLRDGVALGLAFNHAVLDGTSTWHFMSSWAMISSGATAAVSVPPLHDRTKSRNTRVPLDLSQPPPPPESNGNSTAAAPQPLRVRVFRFSESAIATLKLNLNKGTSNSADSKPFSTFQSLSIHIWRAVTHARSLAPTDPTVFTVFADCRHRVSPPMPPSYFGNLIQAIFTGTAAGLLLGNPAAFGADLIRSAIEAHDASAIEKRNSEWEKSPVIFQYKDAGVNCVAVGSSPRFRVYDVDFGFGKPESVRSGGNNRFDGMVYLYQGRNADGAIDVEISLEKGAMERLEMDKDFLLD